MRAFDLACSVPWAILPDALQGILEIANRENPSVEAVEAKLGRKLDNTHAVTYRDGVASIPIDGAIVRRADFFSEVSGAVSVETLAKDLRAALDDPSVQAILLAIDSPGGEVNGIHEFADMIYAARQEKPLTAYISNMGASAAYWIASAASEVVLAHTAFAGSIGVVAAVRDPTKKTAREIEFVSSQSPNKRPDPTTEKGRSQIQAMVDGLADVFVASVARHRSVSVETVLADFGQGDLLMGPAAVASGLADRVGSYESTLAHLAASAREGPGLLSRPAAQTAGTGGRQIMAGEQSKDTGQQSEIEQLKAQLAAAQDREAKAAASAQEARAAAAADRKGRVEAEAKAFAAAEISAGRALPTDQQTIVSAVTLAASEDATAEQRVASVKALVSGRQPGVHLKELVPDPGLTALGAKTTTEASGGAAGAIDMSREAGRKFAEQANGKKKGG